MSSNERQQALTLLYKLFKEKTPLSALITPEILPKTRELCYGICRQYYFLSKLTEQLLDKKPKELKIELAILLGLYQLLFMKQPEYAVVQETVGLMAKNKLVWAKGLVNAVLRRFIKEQGDLVQKAESNQLAIDNHPLWLIELIHQQWPEDALSILQANNQHPPMALRVNTRKISRVGYLSQLEKAGMTAIEHPYASACLILETPCAVDKLPGFLQGLVSVQDAAAQMAASLLQLRPEMSVLDACAAPGGKTCHLLEHEPQLKKVLALDLEPKRLTRVKSNLDRLELHAEILCADALDPPSFWDGKPFDRILLDAPCSALGVIRRHPDIKLLRTLADIQTVIELQKKLLQSLWPLLAKQGLFLYATCSITKEENEKQIQAFLENTPDATLVKLELPWAHDRSYGWQVLPGEAQMDGFFYSLLRKV